MAEKKAETEEQIFEAACRVFQQKGFAGARMQAIADEANINKSMLHYYYRSKDKLFQKVFQREISRFFPIIFGVMGSDDAFDIKIEQLIETYYSFLQDNPYMIQFIILEMNQHPERFRNFIKQKGLHPPQVFFRQIEKEIEAGNINSAKPEQVMISILGVILFPFIARTMIQSVFGLDESDFLQFMRERKGFLKEFILNAINYKKQ